MVTLRPGSLLICLSMLVPLITAQATCHLDPIACQPSIHAGTLTPAEAATYPLGSLKDKQTELINKYKVHTHLCLSIKQGNITCMIDSSRKLKAVDSKSPPNTDHAALGVPSEYLNERWVIDFKSNQPTKNNPDALRMILSLLSNELVDPRNRLFTSLASPGNHHQAGASSVLQVDRFPHQPSHAAFVTPRTYPECGQGSRCFHYFKSVGRAMAVAILNELFLDLTFTRSFYKYILGQPLVLDDLKEMDPAFYDEMSLVLKSILTLNGIYTPTMTYEHFNGHGTEIRELVPKGSKIRVKKENVGDYVDLMVQSYINNHMAPAMNVLCAGLFEIIPREEIGMFNEDQLRVLISGNTDIDVTEWQKFTPNQYMISTWNGLLKRWFWRCVGEWDSDMKSRLLLLVTGTSRLPVNGFNQANNPNLANRWFNILWLDLWEDSIPRAYPDDSHLYFPAYSSYEKMKEKLEQVVLARGGVSTWYNSDSRLPFVHN